MTKKLPKQCRDRNQSYSWHNGKRIYHGIWKSPEADTAYRRFVAELLESLTGVLRHRTGDVQVAELAADFLDHHTTRLDESHVRHFRLAIGYLVEICGDLAVNSFSPKKLKIVRSQMVKKGTLCRKQINDYTGRLVRIFRWGVEEKQVETTTWQALTAVKSLPPGEPGTFDNEIVRGVPRDVVGERHCLYLVKLKDKDGKPILFKKELRLRKYYTVGRWWTHIAPAVIKCYAQT